MTGVTNMKLVKITDNSYLIKGLRNSSREKTKVYLSASELSKLVYEGEQELIKLKLKKNG